MAKTTKIKTPRRARTHNLARRELLRIDGQPVEVTLQLNRRARRLIVRVNPSTGEVTVVAPSQRALSEALAFARTEKEWIATRVARAPGPVTLGLGIRLPFRGETHVVRRGEDRKTPVWIERDGSERIIRVSGGGEHTSRRLFDYLKREARRLFDSRVTEYAAMIGVKPKRITVRDTASRWGSCSSARALSFSWRLVLAPPYVLDYVVAHEVSHLREMNHGARFWQLVESIVGDVERPQSWLSENGALLQRYLPRPSETPAQLT